ncbi:MAG TPA: hypothetical protein VH331_10335 [Allosphingosinicella sp.]|jgi:hypothetical protein|nr:hypothetical protein [Allosphingosinicella sp.]
MIRPVKAAAIPALLLALAACQVTVDNKTQAQVDNASDELDNGADKAGSEIGNVADAAGNAADQLGNDVEKGADKLGNGVSVHVNLNGGKDDKSNGNSQ